MFKEDNSDKGLPPFWYESSPSSEALSQKAAFLPLLEPLGRNSLLSILYTFERARAQAKGEDTTRIKILWQQVNREWIEAISPKLPSCNMRQQATILNDLFSLEDLPPQPFIQKLFCSTTQKLETPTAQQPPYFIDHLCSVLRGAAVLGVFPPGEFLQKLQPAFVGKIRDMENSSIATAAWSLAVFSVLDRLPDSAVELALAFIDEAKTRRLSRVQNHMLNHVCHRFAPEEAKKFAPIITNTSSDYEIKFRALLNSAGLKNNPELCDEATLGTKPDYVFQIDGKVIIGEYDGLTHFLFDPETGGPVYKGSTRLMSALVLDAAQDERLIRIDWQAAQILSENEDLLRLLKPALRYLPSGAFSIKVGENKILTVPIPCAPRPDTYSRVYCKRPAKIAMCPKIVESLSNG